MSATQMITGTQPQTPNSVIIVSLMRAMLVDYPAQYRNSYPTKDDARQLKQRLVSKLANFCSDDVIDGYELCVDDNPKFMPSLPDILTNVRRLSSQRGDAEAKKAEAERVSALPAPTHECDPVKMLESANAGADNDGEQGRSSRLEKARIAHEQLLKAHAGKIDRRYADMDHLCAYYGCRHAGAISGGSNFYCANHYRASL